MHFLCSSKHVVVGGGAVPLPHMLRAAGCGAGGGRLVEGGGGGLWMAGHMVTSLTRDGD